MSEKDVSEPGWRIHMGFVRHLYTPTEELEHRALDAKTGKDEPGKIEHKLFSDRFSSCSSIIFYIYGYF